MRKNRSPSRIEILFEYNLINSQLICVCSCNNRLATFSISWRNHLRKRARFKQQKRTIQLKGSFRVFSQILATSTFVFKKECVIAVQGKNSSITQKQLTDVKVWRTDAKLIF